jgi:hypothetical protein
MSLESLQARAVGLLIRGAIWPSKLSHTIDDNTASTTSETLA